MAFSVSTPSGPNEYTLLEFSLVIYAVICISRAGLDGRRVDLVKMRTFVPKEPGAAGRPDQVIKPHLEQLNSRESYPLHSTSQMRLSGTTCCHITPIPETMGATTQPWAKQRRAKQNGTAKWTGTNHNARAVEFRENQANKLELQKQKW